MGKPDEVAQAKNQLMAEQKQFKWDDLEELFASQIATLKDRGTPEQIVEILQNQKGAVLKKASEMAIGDGNIPFLPVIHISFRRDSIDMAQNGLKEGYNYPKKAATITDQFETPYDPYYIYDVEDGNATRGKSPENAEKTFRSQKRSPLTVAEVIALTVHADVLYRHYVWASGSRYGFAGKEVPVVFLDFNARPGLDFGYVDDSVDTWGSASCGSR